MRRVSGTLITGLFIALVVIILFFGAVTDLRSSALATLRYGEVDSFSPAIPSTKANVYFVGDVMLARDVEQTLLREGLAHPYTNISFNNETDFVVANFEAAIPQIHERTPNNTFRFSVDRRLLPSLSEAGFSHLSLANNHAFDHGLAGFLNTKAVLLENDFVTFGHPTVFSTSSVSFIELKGKKIALIGLHVLFSTPQSEVLQSILRFAAENSDLQVLYIHWGNEYALKHAGSQERLATLASGYGVDIIVGHHPHVVQDISQINNTLVFYSLGNYIFDQYFSIPVQQGLVLRLDESLNIELLPVSSEGNKAQPSFMTEEQRGEFLKNLAQRSDPRLLEQIERGVISYANMLATSSEVAIMAP